MKWKKDHHECNEWINVWWRFYSCSVIVQVRNFSLEISIVVVVVVAVVVVVVVVVVIVIVIVIVK